MKINNNETKIVVMPNNKKRRINIQIDNQRMDQIISIKYLGITTDNSGELDEEINNRITTTTRMFHGVNKEFINKKEIGNKTKMTIYKTIYLLTDFTI